MKFQTHRLSVSTRGGNDIHDLTPGVTKLLDDSGLEQGQVTVFAPGSTAGVTTIEFEPGLIRDLPEALDRVAPMGVPYHHDAAWGDGNGYAHVRAALVGASLVVPFHGRRLILGTWQQVVLMDFDNRPRRREIVVQILGE
ncbi:MAG TPA: YjbQ family protein [bacterium]|nr:YjbQ family protein [bacterium]